MSGHRFDPTTLREYDIRGVLGKTGRPGSRARLRHGGTAPQSRHLFCAKLTSQPSFAREPESPTFGSPELRPRFSKANRCN
jgi:hypothetical protein